MVDGISRESTLGDGYDWPLAGRGVHGSDRDNQLGRHARPGNTGRNHWHSRRLHADNGAVMKHTRGFSLVELMIALLIGLIVVAGIISVFVTEHSVYRTASAQA